MMAHKGLGIVGIDIRLFHHAVKALKLRFVFVLEHDIISAVAMLFKMTADNRACHCWPFAADRLAPKDDHPARQEAEVDIED